ncbi:MAG: helicase-related protein [Alphaproteobacteria bacterium]
MTDLLQDRLSAVLGPTNTGKTHLAIERMLGHGSGMIGFPLRLLARENYDRVVRLKGAAHVALVTGEEKIVPPGARYFLCTVEAMPVERPVDFLAIDEVQLCADAARGHVFTDRLLHARGRHETMLLGAETIRPVLRKLVPGAEHVSRPRFSTLSYAGPRKLTRLPPRSAVVAFSATEVYAMAELMRRQRGGTAVVLGALSPRTRNAQVAMFESGEVDYLVATDAIGMGLNLDLDHVAFARLSKFDGQAVRALSAAELAQIAGRAGRHMTAGTFGTTGDAGPMAPELVEAVENHRFDPVRTLYWRARDLDFRSPRLLLKSLDRPPPQPQLIRVRETEDMQALVTLARDAEIVALASHPAAVRLLWEVCQVPDFQKTLTDLHVRLLARIYRYLAPDDGRLPEDWVARQVARIDRTDGDIDALVGRISQIRTWTYISHRADWMDDAGHWQERAREIEDRLSDSLHERLTQRFVDRRAALLVRRLGAGDDLLSAVKANGDVLVEGEYVGSLEGFQFRADGSVTGAEAKPLLTAARRALTGTMPGRVRELERDGDEAFALDTDGRLTWRGMPVARLVRGESALKPEVEPLASEFLDGRRRERLRLRLTVWLRRHLETELAPLFRLVDAVARSGLGGHLRGLLFQLVESFGLVPRRTVAAQVRGLTRADRRVLADLGVRLGAESVFLPALLRARSARLRGLLWAVHGKMALPPLPRLGRRIIAPSAGLDPRLYQSMGYRHIGGRNGTGATLRADTLERLAREARRLSAQGTFAVTPRLRDLAGGAAEAEIVLAALGYRVCLMPDGTRILAPAHAANGKAGRRGRARRRRLSPGDAESPFAKLRELDRGK